MLHKEMSQPPASSNSNKQSLLSFLGACGSYSHVTRREAAVLEQLVDMFPADRADFAGNSAVGRRCRRGRSVWWFCTSEEGSQLAGTAYESVDTKSGMRHFYKV
jgi:hypothetical protein